MPLSTHMFRNHPLLALSLEASKKEGIPSPCTLEFDRNSNPKDPYTKTKTCN